jgi:hypothetical protein
MGLSCEATRLDGWNGAGRLTSRFSGPELALLAPAAERDRYTD